MRQKHLPNWGVTTQNPRRVQAIVISDKYRRVANYHNKTVKSFLDLIGALGLTHPDELKPEQIFKQMPDNTVKTLREIYQYLTPGELLGHNINPAFHHHWEIAEAERFV